jgi:hypothetical protein
MGSDPDGSRHDSYGDFLPEYQVRDASHQQSDHNVGGSVGQSAGGRVHRHRFTHATDFSIVGCQ